MSYDKMDCIGEWIIIGGHKCKTLYGYFEGKGFVFHTGVYYNIDGEIAIELSEYNRKRIYFCDSFYNGYALMLIEVTDQLTYFMVIIKAENFSLNPKRVLTMCIWVGTENI